MNYKATQNRYQKYTLPLYKHFPLPECFPSSFPFPSNFRITYIWWFFSLLDTTSVRNKFSRDMEVYGKFYTFGVLVES